MHVIYVIGGNEPPYKIGYSSNLSARLAALQTSHPAPLRAILSAESQTPREHERALHDDLACHRLVGEWFSCDLDVIATSMREIGLMPDYSVLPSEPGWVDGPTFESWVAEMRKPPFFANDAACAKLLGISANGLLKMKKQGTDRRTALACRALLHRMEPYGS